MGTEHGLLCEVGYDCLYQTRLLNWILLLTVFLCHLLLGIGIIRFMGLIEHLLVEVSDGAIEESDGRCLTKTGSAH